MIAVLGAAAILDWTVTPDDDRSALPPHPLVQHWLQRHPNPTSFILHMIGIPPTILGVCSCRSTSRLLSLPIFFLALALFVGGYLLQFAGHCLEGTDPGEIIYFKRKLGCPTSSFRPDASPVRASTAPQPDLRIAREVRDSDRPIRRGRRDRSSGHARVSASLAAQHPCRIGQRRLIELASVSRGFAGSRDQPGPDESRVRCRPPHFGLGLIGEIDKIRPIVSSRTSRTSDPIRQVDHVGPMARACATAAARSARCADV